MNETPTPRLPDPSEHIAIAGRTGTGKTTAALDMLSRRDMRKMAWILIDHKGAEAIKKLSLPPIRVDTKILPDKGAYHLKAKYGDAKERDRLEDFLARILRHGKIGIYIDEGHLMGVSDALRSIMVAGREKCVPVMWCSQRAQQIDPFIWSQSSFYRVFALQTRLDKKRFEENFPIAWEEPGKFQSYYYDVGAGTVFLLKPSENVTNARQRILEQTGNVYHHI